MPGYRQRLKLALAKFNHALYLSQQFPGSAIYARELERASAALREADQVFQARRQPPKVKPLSYKAQTLYSRFPWLDPSKKKSSPTR
jgi:hypothetical protein